MADIRLSVRVNSVKEPELTHWLNKQTNRSRAIIAALRSHVDRLDSPPPVAPSSDNGTSTALLAVMQELLAAHQETNHLLADMKVMAPAAEGKKEPVVKREKVPASAMAAIDALIDQGTAQDSSEEAAPSSMVEALRGTQ